MGQSFAILLVVALIGGILFWYVANNENLGEVQQQAVAVYDWISCKFNGGVPAHDPQKENYYSIVCN